MSNPRRARAMPIMGETPARLLPVMSELRKEVRAMSRDAHRLALARASVGGDDYHRQLCAVFESWMESGAPQVQVICFASAAEFGLPMHQHAERCRTWAMQHGSGAHRALYWAALHRTRSRFGTMAQMAGTPEAEAAAWAARGALPARTQPADHGASRPPNEASRPCGECESLRLDARCAKGHGALRPVGEVRAHSIGTGALCRTREHRCTRCGTRWTQHRSAADPFTGWTTSRAMALA